MRPFFFSWFCHSVIESWTHINHSLLEIDHLWSCNKLNKSYFKLKPWMSHLKGASRQRNNSESQWGIEPQAFGFWTPMLISDPSRMQDVCHMNFVIDLIHHRVSVAQWQSIRARNPKVWGAIPHGDSEFFLCPTLITRQKPSFSISLQSISLILFTNMMLYT